MKFIGAITEAGASQETDELTSMSAIYPHLAREARPDNIVRNAMKVLRSAKQFISCEFNPELLGDFEDILDVYEPIKADRLAVTDAKFRSGKLPLLDIGFAFDLPLRTPLLSYEDILVWERKQGVSLSDAVTLYWMSPPPENEYLLPIDQYREKILVSQDHHRQGKK